MSDTTHAAAPAAEAPQSTEQKQDDPFAGFQAEAFDRGEPIEEAAPASAPQPKPAEGEAPPAAEAEGGEPKKPQTAQERINELTRLRREAERREDDLRRQLEELQRRLPPAPKDAAAPPPAKTDAPKGPPKPEDFEFGELDSAYIAAVVDYQTERRFAEFHEMQAKEREQAAATERQRSVQEKFQQQVEQGKQKYADFDTVVVEGAQAGTWPLSETMALLLVESDVGEDIAYHLATNPDEAASVDRLAPVEQARYFGRLEAKFSAARAAAPGGDSSAEKPATAKAPKAPPPVETARGAGGRFQTTAATDDFLAFEAAATKG